MQLHFASLALLATPVVSFATGLWVPAFPWDARSPCPMVNSLANHGFLPRSGRNVSMDDLIQALNASVNLAEDATRLVGAKALAASTTGNPNTFNLDDLNRHGFIEHDGSLSRNDVYFGDNYSFNRTIWTKTASHFTGSKISLATAAAARKARLADAAAVNPEFNLTASELQFSFIETALYFSVFGGLTEGNATTRWVKTLFEHERLPYIEGWRRSSSQITTQAILGVVGQLVTL